MEAGPGGSARDNIMSMQGSETGRELCGGQIVSKVASPWIPCITGPAGSKYLLHTGHTRAPMSVAELNLWDNRPLRNNVSSLAFSVMHNKNISKAKIDLILRLGFLERQNARLNRPIISWGCLYIYRDIVDTKTCIEEFENNLVAHTTANLVGRLSLVHVG